jgi:hypothetical protein
MFEVATKRVIKNERIATGAWMENEVTFASEM